MSSGDRENEIGLRVGSGISKEKAAQLNPGSMILVTGVTESIDLVNREHIEGNPQNFALPAGSGGDMRIVLSDLHSE